MNRANTVLDNTNTLTGNLAAINVAGTMEKVNETLDNVEKLTSQLNNTEGSIGLLLRDPSLYQNLNATMRDADSLLVNMKAHPKRYVHFSLFGRKDK
jgi:phospholipid/cholesterol/gamma-HCH transport system substrate-binding protein